MQSLSQAFLEWPSWLSAKDWHGLPKSEFLSRCGICLPCGIAPEMLPGSNAQRLLEIWPRSLVNVIIDPPLSGPKELKKVDSPICAGLADTQQHHIFTDATLR